MPGVVPAQVRSLSRSHEPNTGLQEEEVRGGRRAGCRERVGCRVPPPKFGMDMRLGMGLFLIVGNATMEGQEGLRATGTRAWVVLLRGSMRAVTRSPILLYPFGYQFNAKGHLLGTRAMSCLRLAEAQKPLLFGCSFHFPLETPSTRLVLFAFPYIQPWLLYWWLTSPLPLRRRERSYGEVCSTRSSTSSWRAPWARTATPGWRCESRPSAPRSSSERPGQRQKRDEGERGHAWTALE